MPTRTRTRDHSPTTTITDDVAVWLETLIAATGDRMRRRALWYESPADFRAGVDLVTWALTDAARARAHHEHSAD